MKVMASSLLLCWLLVMGTAQVRKSTGVIYGSVVSQKGQQVKRITLFAEPLNVGGQYPSTRSDDRGDYRFENLPWGRYTVFADDPDHGYSGTVIDDSSQPSVEISPERPKSQLRVLLPAKAGVLQISLTNRSTGARIPWVGVTVVPTEEPGPSVNLTCKSTELVLVPPDRKLLLHITADGFREWGESAGAGKSIFVPSGTRLKIAVQLDPAL